MFLPFPFSHFFLDLRVYIRREKENEHFVFLSVSFTLEPRRQEQGEFF